MEEARLLLELAETGHLVLASLRGFDTASSLRRWPSLFLAEELTEARERLARALRFSFTQRLVPHEDGKWRPVVEVFRHSQKASEFLIKGQRDTGSTADFLRDGEGEGQKGFDRELEQRVRAGVLAKETALAYAVQPSQLELRLLDVQEAG